MDLVSSDTTRPTRARPTILVVDDDPDVARLVGVMLTDFADVRACHDGAEALELLSGAWRPAAIVTDVTMPRMDGLELVAHLKRDERNARIPVIMLSARSTPADVIRGIQAGVRSYVCKPFDRRELVSKVRRAIGA